MTHFNKPIEVSDIDVAFAASVVGKLLPKMADIPEEFRKGNKWTEKASDLFFNGGNLPEPKDGIDKGKAKRHLQCVLSSFEPKHEHKEAGAGYLMSLWYKNPEAK